MTFELEHKEELTAALKNYRIKTIFLLIWFYHDDIYLKSNESIAVSCFLGWDALNGYST